MPQDPTKLLMDMVDQPLDWFAPAQRRRILALLQQGAVASTPVREDLLAGVTIWNSVILTLDPAILTEAQRLAPLSEADRHKLAINMIAAAASRAGTPADCLTQALAQALPALLPTGERPDGLPLLYGLAHRQVSGNEEACMPFVQAVVRGGASLEKMLIYPEPNGAEDHVLRETCEVLMAQINRDELNTHVAATCASRPALRM